jgi:hypothetical protein
MITEDQEHYIGRVFEKEDGWHYDLLSSVADLGISHDRFIVEWKRGLLLALSSNHDR